ncbi:MAG: TetR family transcriptional regulator, partial [bacterium]
MSRLPAAERRDQIAEAALALLAEGGTAALTAAALGRAVGLRDASLFRHFPDKAAIVAAAVDRFDAALADSLDRPEADPLERLGAFFLHRQALLRARPVLLRLAFNERLVEAAAPADRPRILGIL